MKAADYISQFLEQKNVSNAFGMSGANIEDLFSAIQKKNKTEIILAKNEYNAATMAMGSYLATQKPSVVLTTSGPGVLNTIPVLVESFSSQIPFVLISGLVPTQLEGMGAFQDTSGLGGTVDICQMIRHCTCFNIKIKNANEIPAALEKAYSLSLKYKKPSAILIPKDIFTNRITEFTISKERFAEKNTCPLELINAINFCRQFSRNIHTPPLIILGEELLHLESIERIKEFVKKSCAGVALTACSKGLFDHKDPQFLGLAGIMGHNEVNDYLEHTEHVILVGTRMDLLTRFGMEKAFASKHILIIKEEKGPEHFFTSGKSLCEIYGDIETNFAKIIESLIPKKLSHSLQAAKQNTEMLGYNLRNMINEITQSIENEANIFIDAGNSGAFVVHHLEASGKGVCYVSLGMGGMGNSVGAGIGSAAATGKKTYIFLGDGAFLMHGLEIHTALENSLPVVFFIFNNNSHGMCSTRENIFLGGETGLSNFRKSNFAAGIEQMFPGITAHEVGNMEQLRSGLNDIRPRSNPCILSLNIENDEAPPFKSFIKINEVNR
ncbi:MAG: thiamine pyrophosphate-binding protein [Bacteriovorax sp.]